MQKELMLRAQRVERDGTCVDLTRFSLRRYNYVELGSFCKLRINFFMLINFFRNISGYFLIL